MKGRQGFSNLRYKGKKIKPGVIGTVWGVHIYAPWYEYPPYWIKRFFNLFRRRKRYVYQPGERPLVLNFPSNKPKELLYYGVDYGYENSSSNQHDDTGRA